MAISRQEQETIVNYNAAEHGFCGCVLLFYCIGISLNKSRGSRQGREYCRLIQADKLSPEMIPEMIYCRRNFFHNKIRVVYNIHKQMWNCVI